MRHLYNDPVQQQKQLTVFIDFFLNCPETKSNSRSFDRKFLIDIFSSNTNEKSFLQLLLMMATMGYGKSVLPSSPSFTENIPKCLSSPRNVLGLDRGGKETKINPVGRLVGTQSAKTIRKRCVIKLD